MVEGGKKTIGTEGSLFSDNDFFERRWRRFLTWLLCSFGDWSSGCGGLRGGHLDLDDNDEDDDGDVALG